MPDPQDIEGRVAALPKEDQGRVRDVLRQTLDHELAAGAAGVHNLTATDEHTKDSGLLHTKEFTKQNPPTITDHDMAQRVLQMDDATFKTFSQRLNELKNPPQ
jgi:hypothetical protein